jgi:hypothetical protein
VGWLQTRIPPVSATELGVYRLLFGLGLAYVVHDLRLPQEPFPLELHLRVHPIADYEWVHTLATRPDLVGQLEWVIIGLSLAFAIGFFSRTTFALLVAAVTAWTLVRLTRTGTHNWSAMFVTLWAMLPVRWGDGFSIDALVGRLRGRRAPVERRIAYGYALWIPGLVFGAAMAGAGAAKLVQSGLTWITNASVKYHFVIDAEHAPTDWGLWIASHHGVAVFVSAMAVVTELSLVLAVLVPSYLGRLPFALLGLGLLVGFHVFQNELWCAWWQLYLAFFVDGAADHGIACRCRASGSATAHAASARNRHSVRAAAGGFGRTVRACAGHVGLPDVFDYLRLNRGLRTARRDLARLSLRRAVRRRRRGGCQRVLRRRPDGRAAQGCLCRPEREPTADRPDAHGSPDGRQARVRTLRLPGARDRRADRSARVRLEDRQVRLARGAKARAHVRH